ncbi:MAG: hypothetical protein CVU30_14390 [Betaproteobacteria bacterium HGW-Betaproteobacteria-3]|jgi:hypothetical protein|nr:MAG: hypothetical protein CVU30_14390 [Betaproteobacteria bacterium HGW-Betaproteobacteria-3]
MSALNTATSRTADELDALARKRAGARMGWYAHALVYVVVNTALVLLSLATGRHWAIFPALGWGLGLAMHGFGVWLSLGGGGLHERLLARERERLAAQRDPW